MDRHSSETIWNEALILIRAKVNDGTFKIWFENTLGLDFTGDTFVVGVPSEFAKDWIETRFLEIMTEAISEVVGDRVGCRLSVSAELAARLQEQGAGAFVEAGGSLDDGDSLEPADEGVLRARGVAAVAPDGASRGPGSQASAPAVAPSRASELGLNNKYTFETFVVGQSNRFAHAAALAAAETPGTEYNPLFIYGGVGSERPTCCRRSVTTCSATPRAQGLLHDVWRPSPTSSSTPCATRASRASSSVTGATTFSSSTTSSSFEKKEQTQEEFFHTFNTLYDARSRSSSLLIARPKGLATLEDRLVSRFEWGLITDIQPPDLETRMAILRKKVLTDRVVLANEEDPHSHSFARSHQHPRTRRLSHPGRGLRFVQPSRPIDVDLAREVLKDIPEIAGTRVTVEVILGVVRTRRESR